MSKFFLLQSIFKKFINCPAGATAIEYAILVSFLAVAILASVYLFGEDLIQLYEVLSAMLQEFFAGEE